MFLAIDPSLTCCGYCIFDEKGIRGAASFRPKGNKLIYICREFKYVIASHSIKKVYVENSFKQGERISLHHDGGIGAALNVGKGATTSTLIIGLCFGLGIDCQEVSPHDWNPKNISKKKGLVKRDMQLKYGFKESSKLTLDAYDAIAIANYALHFFNR